MERTFTLASTAGHADLTSASILPRRPLARTARWTLKQVQGDGSRILRTRLLVFPAVLLSLNGCGTNSDWSGWVYPDRNSLTDDIPIGSYATLEDCRKSARNILERLKKTPDNASVAGDYECGFKCKADSGLGGINVCEKTER